MSTGPLVGTIAFLLSLVALGSALAGRPRSSLGRGNSVLVAAALVVGPLHHVVPTSDPASGLASLISVALIVTALVRSPR